MELESLKVRIIGDNSQYLKVLKNSLNETRKYVKSMNAELAKLNDVGVGLGGGGKGKGGGRGKGGGKAGMAFAAIDLFGDMAELSGQSDKLGIDFKGLSNGVGNAVEMFGGMNNVIKILSKAGLPGLIAAVGAVATKFTYDFHPATKQAAENVERLTKTVEGFKASIPSMFNDRMFEMQFLEGGEEKVQFLKDMAADLRNSYDIAETEAIQLANEIERLEGHPVDSWLDAHAIELAKKHLEDARNKVEMFGDQAEQVERQLRVAQHQAAKEAERLAKDREENNPFAKHMRNLDTELINREIATKGMESGLSDEEIKREQELVKLKLEAEAYGMSLTEQQIERIRGLDEEIMRHQKIQEEMKEQEKQQAKLAEEQAKAIAKAQQEEAKAQQQYLDDVAQRSKAYLDSMLTPIEQLQTEIADIEELVRAGGLTGEQGQSLIDKRIKDMAEATGTARATGGGAVRAGSTEAYSLTRFGNQRRSSEEDIRNMLKENKKQSTTLEQIRDGIEGNFFGEPMVASIPGA